MVWLMGGVYTRVPLAGILDYGGEIYDAGLE